MQIKDVHQVDEYTWKLILELRFLWLVPLRTRWIGIVTEKEIAWFRDDGKPANIILNLYLSTEFFKLRGEVPWPTSKDDANQRPDQRETATGDTS